MALRVPRTTIRQNVQQGNDADADGQVYALKNDAGSSQKQPLSGPSSSSQLIASSTGTCRSSVAQFSYDGREREHQVTDIEIESTSSSVNVNSTSDCSLSEDPGTNNLSNPLQGNAYAHRTWCCSKLLTIDPRVASFWFMGLLNNIPYVIMLAGAKDIAEGGTALVFVANVFPALLVKLSAPYWFPLVTYGTRTVACTFFFVVSFLVVAYFSNEFEADSTRQDNNNDDMGNHSASQSLRLKRDIAFELIGVMLGSLACGMGEVSISDAWHARVFESHQIQDDLLTEHQSYSYICLLYIYRPLC
jgi:hypothetical protein